MEQGSIQYEVQHFIGWITFSHPRGNSLPGHLLQELADAIYAAGADEAVRVIVLQSGGEKAFCAGASFDELVALETISQGKRFFSGFAKVINAARKCPKLIIGRVQGKAVGGGVGLAAATDYCLASRQADIRLSELAIGIGPFVIGPAVERKVGRAAFSQLAINAFTWKSAAWAQQHGLYAELYDSFSELDEAVDRLAQQLAACNPQAMRRLKEIFWEGTSHWDQLLSERAESSGELALSTFTREAIAAFLKKN